MIRSNAILWMTGLVCGLMNVPAEAFVLTGEIAPGEWHHFSVGDRPGVFQRVLRSGTQVGGYYHVHNSQSWTTYHYRGDAAELQAVVDLLATLPSRSSPRGNIIAVNEGEGFWDGIRGSLPRRASVNFDWSLTIDHTSPNRLQPVPTPQRLTLRIYLGNGIPREFLKFPAEIDVVEGHNALDENPSKPADALHAIARLRRVPKRK